MESKPVFAYSMLYTKPSPENAQNIEAASEYVWLYLHSFNPIIFTVHLYNYRLDNSWTKPLIFWHTADSFVMIIRNDNTRQKIHTIDS